MALISNTYGKDRVRVMRVHRTGERHEVRELSVLVMVQGDFARTYTHADNADALCTDTMKNLVAIVAHDNPALEKESFCAAVADRLLSKYPQVSTATVTAHETKWRRLVVDGRPHPHSFVLDGNGQPFATVVASRETRSLQSGVSGFTFLKATQSGWDNFYKDDYTTLKETRDRICATSMEASWRWQRTPPDFEAANARLLDSMLAVFATTYSHSVQDSLYRMATAGLEAVPEVSDIRLACPNKHYIPINLSPFGRVNDNEVFVPTDEPHGQIECQVGRG
jgi:urate oxidase